MMRNTNKLQQRMLSNNRPHNHMHEDSSFLLPLQGKYVLFLKNTLFMRSEIFWYHLNQDKITVRVSCNQIKT